MNSTERLHIAEVYAAIARGRDLRRLLPVGSARAEIAVGEVSGRDSVAAIVRAVEENQLDRILPVADDLPNLRGEWSDIYNNVEWLKAQYGEVVLDLTVFVHGDLYRELIELSCFHLGTPCVGCHLYFHVYPVPVVLALGGRQIIAGERVSHDGLIKINQVPFALEKYEQAVQRLGAELLLPIAHVTRAEQVIEILGHSRYFSAQNPQLKCDLEFGRGRFISQSHEMDASLEAFFDDAIPLVEEKILPYTAC